MASGGWQWTQWPTGISSARFPMDQGRGRRRGLLQVADGDLRLRKLLRDRDLLMKR